MRGALPAALAQAHERSVSIYLQRQQVQGELVRLQQVAARLDLELIELDGAIKALTSLSGVPDGE